MWLTRSAAVLITAIGCGALAPVTLAKDPAPTTASSTHVAKPSFDLTESQVRQLLKSQGQTLESPEAVRIANDWRTGRSSRAVQKPEPTQMRARPAMIECARFEEKCIAYGADGRYLYTVPHPPAKVRIDEADRSGSCQSSNNMMSTFERADRCNGAQGGVIQSFWDVPVRRYVP